MSSAPAPQRGVRSTLVLALGALGVVYGDIGTSPLYTVHEVFAGSGHIPLTPEHVIGVEVRQEDMLEVDEPDIRAEELPLCPLAAVDKQAIPATPDERRRRPTGRSRRRGGRSEEDEVEIHGGRS